MIKVSTFEEKRGSFKSGGSFKWAPLGVTLPTSRGLQTTDVTTHALTGLISRRRRFSSWGYFSENVFPATRPNNNIPNQWIHFLSFKPNISKSLLNPELAVNFPVKSVDKSTGKNYISWPQYRFRNRFAGRENWRISWKIPPPGSSGKHRSRRERLRHLHRNCSRTRRFSSQPQWSFFRSPSVAMWEQPLLSVF